MDVSGNNNVPSRAQGPPKPSDAQAGTRGPNTSSVSEWSFTPGPYDRRGYYIPPSTAGRLPNTIASGPPSAQGPARQIPTTSSTHIAAPQIQPAGVPPSHNTPSTESPPVIDPSSICVMVYLSMDGAPFSFNKQSGPSTPVEKAWITRAQLSAAWLRPSVRSVLWANPETRRQIIASISNPAPMSFEEAKNVVLNNVGWSARLNTTQEVFWKSLRFFFPLKAGSRYHISEWAMLCAQCGKEITGYASDALWNERYLHHRTHSCGRIEEGKSAEHPICL